MPISVIALHSQRQDACLKTSGPPSIAAIVPLHNGRRYVGEAIESVLKQTLRPDEFIIVDDGSTDDGAVIVDDYVRRGAPITLIHQANLGQSAARNRGIGRSQSGLIALLDQDDTWHPDHLAELVLPFTTQRSRRLGWTYSNLDRVDERGTIVTPSMLSHVVSPHPKTSLRDCLQSDMFILPSAALFTRDAFEAAGRFDERLSGYEDDDLFLRMFMAGFDNVYIDKPLSTWRHHKASASYSPRMAESRMLYMHKLMRIFPDGSPSGPFLTRDIIAPRFLRCVLIEYMQAATAGEKLAAKRLLADFSAILPCLDRSRRLAVRCMVPLLVHTALLKRLRPLIRLARPLVKWALSKRQTSGVGGSSRSLMR